MERMDTALVISREASWMMCSSILGTGGWLPPEGRQAMDWMSLVRLLGWRAELIIPETFSPQMISDLQVKWIIVADNPQAVESSVWDTLLETVRVKSILLLTQAGFNGSQFALKTGINIDGTIAEGSILQWQGSSEAVYWQCRKKVQLPLLHLKDEFKVVVTLSGNTLVATKTIGLGKILMLSFEAGHVRDQEGVFSALLKHLLIYESVSPVAWYEWKNTLILRMDDPGSAEVMYNEAYDTIKLGSKQWEDRTGVKQAQWQNEFGLCIRLGRRW
jgi:hypothetical protein